MFGMSYEAIGPGLGVLVLREVQLTKALSTALPRAHTLIALGLWLGSGGIPVEPKDFIGNALGRAGAILNGSFSSARADDCCYQCERSLLEL